MTKIQIKNTNALVIGHLNINSLPNKFDQLKLIIKNKFGILVITETKLDSSFADFKFIIAFFKFNFIA